MEKQIHNQPRCKNCNYFVEYYVRRGNYFQPTGNGYCTNKNCNGKKSVKICSYFELKSKDLEKQERLSSATNTLKVISEMIEYLTQVFKAEENIGIDDSPPQND